MLPSTSFPDPTASPLDGAVRRCGGQMVERHGQVVAANYGSAASEASVCLKTVGMTDRFERITLGLFGDGNELDQALSAMASLAAGQGWWTRLAADRAIVRCEEGDREHVLASLGEGGPAFLSEIGDDYAAIGLLGPRVGALLEAAGVDEHGEEPIVIRETDASCELLIAVSDGPTLWDRMLAAGAPLGLACVGAEALEHLAASHRFGAKVHPTARC